MGDDRKGLLTQLEVSAKRLCSIFRTVNSFEHFYNSPDTHELCLYHLGIICETVIALARDVLVRLGLPVSNLDLSTLISTLAKNNIIKPDFVRPLQELMSMRDNLLHPYLGLDFQKVFYFLKEHADKFNDLAKEFEKFSGRQNEV